VCTKIMGPVVLSIMSLLVSDHTVCIGQAFAGVVNPRPAVPDDKQVTILQHLRSLGQRGSIDDGD
jgi:hypothetical protein